LGQLKVGIGITELFVLYFAQKTLCITLTKAKHVLVWLRMRLKDLLSGLH